MGQTTLLQYFALAAFSSYWFLKCMFLVRLVKFTANSTNNKNNNNKYIYIKINPSNLG